LIDILTLNCFLNLSKHILCGKHLHDCIISPLGEVWSNKTRLIPPHFVEVCTQSQESELFRQWF